MVEGLDRFGEHFAAYTDQYVLIGGAACTLAMDEAGQQAICLFNSVPATSLLSSIPDAQRDAQVSSIGAATRSFALLASSQQRGRYQT